MPVELPESFTCQCGRECDFPPYVFNFPNRATEYRCECNREYKIKNFEVKQA